MKKITLLCSIMLILCITTNLFSQTTFDWETAIGNGTNVTQTVNGITAIVTDNTNTNIDIATADGLGFGSSGKVLYTPNAGTTNSITISFSSSIDISSIFVFDIDGNGAPTWTFTPTGGTNSAVNEQLNGTVGETVPLNWTGITSFTITTSGSFDTFGIDNIEIPVPCTTPIIPTVTYAPGIICDGNAALISISGTLNDATQWNLYTDSCGGTLVATTTSNSIIVTPPVGTTTYYVRGEGGCVTPSTCGTVTITTTTREDASFSYNASAYCVDEADPTPTITYVSGGTFTSTAGLSINSNTGTIDLSASTPNTYTVHYYTNGLCSGTETTTVTINALDNASFSYDAATYCADTLDPTATITGLTGGTFSSTAGLNINASTGTIDTSASIPGTYTVTYTTAGACPNSSNVGITINALDNASFSYDAATYCAGALDPTATITGLTGGTFSSTAGLSINASTGTIDTSASIPGTYTVTYTTAGACPNSSNVGITINALDNASFSYDASSYTTNSTDPIPTITGLAGGIFSSTAGLSINASTGEIDISASTIATYIVTYTTTDTCSNSSNMLVTIQAPPTYTWTGAFNNTWNITLNWNPTTVPPQNADIIIPSGLINYPTTNSPVTFNTLTIESGASFIPNSTVTGTVNYKRNLPTTNWYLISSPLSNVAAYNFIDKNNIATGSNSNLGLAFYDTNNSAWEYLQAIPNGSPLPPLMMDQSGYSVKVTTPGDITFTGSCNSTTINHPISTDGNNFNLVGNPYSSYINLGDFFNDNTTGNIVSESTIWLWNEATNNYELKMSGIDADFQISPGQGFFVKAAANTNITFDVENQNHLVTDTFQKNQPKTQVVLNATENGTTKSTKIYYINGTTKGFDDGYDGTLFGGKTNDYDLYSQLVADNVGANYAIQSLPNNDMENTVVPVGLEAKVGKKIIFSANTTSLPNNFKVYLEDRLKGKFINLSEKNYTTTLESTAKGIGQFFIHTTSKNLDNTPITQDLENITIYKSANNSITITGLQTDKALINVFSILGKKIYSTHFKSNGISTIKLPKTAKGVYVIKLRSKLGQLSKKIILE
ncbi:T9SS type A sorting domain-containing protein [Tenacibaculum aestuariivivum]|uniref:T9SS type A sorting domain-containing protein n=1 Tax=Tenacibaculum aestuariivivum TaxID=2006131 RepID=UPI003AB2D6B3